MNKHDWLLLIEQTEHGLVLAFIAAVLGTLLGLALPAILTLLKLLLP